MGGGQFLTVNTITVKEVRGIEEGSGLSLLSPNNIGFHVGDARVKKLTPASKMCDRSGPII